MNARCIADRVPAPVQAIGIRQVLSAPCSPWQRAYVERVIGTIRRESLDHMIVFSERCPYRHVRSFTNYYHCSRTHLTLNKDSPEPRPVQRPTLAGSSPSRKSVDSTIGTRVAPSEQKTRAPSRFLILYGWLCGWRESKTEFGHLHDKSI
jgi:hypothetical protein